MVDDRSRKYPIGAEVTVDQLTTGPYTLLAELCAHEPVSWLPHLNTWMVTGRDLAIEAMRDTERFTVDDPRFTTGAILGPSMLSLEGDEHQRHRSAFAPAFRPGILREEFDDYLKAEVGTLIGECDPAGSELRTQIAGPLAVNTITAFLGLENVTGVEVLGWYQNIATAITDLTIKGHIDPADQRAVDQIKQRVQSAIDNDQASAILRSIKASGALNATELGAEALVIMFGAIETAEGMTTNALWHLLTTERAWARVRDDRSLMANAIEESLRLEPAASFVDRYATATTNLGAATIPAGEKVSVNLLAANRDPAHFASPARFDLARANAKQHVAFVQGPHGCIGLHLARMETAAALEGLLNVAPDLAYDPHRSTPPGGFIFRKPEALWATW